jgi:hypothetical protein
LWVSSQLVVAPGRHPERSIWRIQLQPFILLPVVQLPGFAVEKISDGVISDEICTQSTHC